MSLNNFNLTNSDLQAITLDPFEFKNRLEKTEKAILVDVRTKMEIREGYIPGAKFIDYSDPNFEKVIKTLNKNQFYFLYCRSGGRSQEALIVMKINGFNKVYHLGGGIMAWQLQRMEVAKN